MLIRDNRGLTKPANNNSNSRLLAATYTSKFPRNNYRLAPLKLVSTDVPRRKSNDFYSFQRSITNNNSTIKSKQVMPILKKPTNP